MPAPSSAPDTDAAFVAKWAKVTASEKATAENLLGASIARLNTPEESEQSVPIAAEASGPYRTGAELN